MHTLVCFSLALVVWILGIWYISLQIFLVPCFLSCSQLFIELLVFLIGLFNIELNFINPSQVHLGSTKPLTPMVKNK